MKKTRHQVNPCMVFEYEKASKMVKSLHNAGLLILFEHGSLSILIIKTLGSLMDLCNWHGSTEPYWNLINFKCRSF